MTTAARIQTSASAHWYDPATKSALHTIIAKGTGLPRQTTLADARKLGLVPSVSTILRVIDKPALNSWLREQAVLAALTTPRVEGEDLDAFVSRVLSVDAEQEAQKARDFGILIHDQISDSLNGRPIAPGTEDFIEPVLAILKDFGRVVSTERIVFGIGYAGTLDALFESNYITIIDIKTTRKVPKTGSYNEHCYQTAAYAKAVGNTGNKRIQTANLYVSSTEPGECCVYVQEDWNKSREAFNHILQFWKIANDY